MMDETSRARIPVEIERALAATDEVRALIGELDQELSANYAAEQRHGLALAAIFQPHVRFFVARMRGSPVGCGGVALFSDFAEIKRMYVRSEARGQGVADAIIARLAAEASDAGLTCCGWRPERASSRPFAFIDAADSSRAKCSNPIRPCRRTPS